MCDTWGPSASSMLSSRGGVPDRMDLINASPGGCRSARGRRWPSGCARLVVALMLSLSCGGSGGSSGGGSPGGGGETRGGSGGGGAHGGSGGHGVRGDGAGGAQPVDGAFADGRAGDAP